MLSRNNGCKMKLAVFGDSFAAIKIGQEGTTKEKYHWPNIVAKMLNIDKHDNFALGGTSIDWSYMNFMKYHKNYDILIFVVTADSRSSIITEYPVNNFKHICSFFAEQPLSYNEHLNDSVLKSPINNLIDFKILKNELYKFKHYPSTHQLAHSAMRDSIIHRRPDTILIDAFPNVRSPLWTKEDESPCMYNIQIADFHNNGHFDRSKWTKMENKLQGDDERFCHMTISQNKKFAEYVYKHINEDNFDIHQTLQINSIQNFYELSKL